jgi:hypothetical protein
MKDAEVLMPIKCPDCNEEWLEGFSVALAADALMSGRRLRMRGRCHSKEWDATQIEMEQIRQYLGAGCIGPGNAGVRHAAEVSVRVSIGPTPRSAPGSSRRLEKPTYTRLTRESAAFRSRNRGSGSNFREVGTPAAKLLSALRRLWVFDLVFQRRGR